MKVRPKVANVPTRSRAEKPETVVIPDLPEFLKAKIPKEGRIQVDGLNLKSPKKDSKPKCKLCGKGNLIEAEFEPILQCDNCGAGTKRTEFMECGTCCEDKNHALIKREVNAANYQTIEVWRCLTCQANRTRIQ